MSIINRTAITAALFARLKTSEAEITDFTWCDPTTKLRSEAKVLRPSFEFTKVFEDYEYSGGDRLPPKYKMTYIVTVDLGPSHNADTVMNAIDTVMLWAIARGDTGRPKEHHNTNLGGLVEYARIEQCGFYQGNATDTHGIQITIEALTA